MKKALLIVGLIMSFTSVVYAQQLDSLLMRRANPEDPDMPIKDVIKYIGSDVYVRDTVKGSKMINDSLRLIFLGRKSPKQVLTVIVKGKILNKQLKFGGDDNDVIRCNGNAIIYKGKPAIIIISEQQLATRILL